MPLGFDYLKHTIIAAVNAAPDLDESTELVALVNTLDEFWVYLNMLSAWELYMAFRALAWFDSGIGTPRIVARRKQCETLATLIYKAYELADVRETSRETWQPLKFADVWLRIANDVHPHTQDEHYERVRATAVREAQDFITMEMTRKCPPRFEQYRPQQGWRKLTDVPVPTDSQPFEAWHKEHGLQLVSACVWHLDPIVDEKVIYFNVIGERHKPIMNDAWCEDITHWRPVRPGPANV